MPMMIDGPNTTSAKHEARMAMWRVSSPVSMGANASTATQPSRMPRFRRTRTLGWRNVSAAEMNQKAKPGMYHASGTSNTVAMQKHARATYAERGMSR